MFRATAPASSRASGSRTSDVASGSGPQVQRHPSSSKYPWRLNFYNEQPVDDVTLEEFEEFAIARLRMLALVESSHIRGLPHSQLTTLFKAACTKYLPLAANTAKSTDHDKERKKDVVSHFVLRLAFCGSEELRRRFLKAETTLFRLRFESDDAEERQSFLKALQLDWTIVSPEEKESLQAELLSTTPTLSPTWARETFFKVPWTLVPDLVSRRMVYLKGGFAYVPQKEQMSLVLQAFQERLERGLETTAKHLPRLDEDARLLPILNHLSLSYLNGSTSSEYMPDDENSERVTAEQVDHLAPRHFPPCARHLWETGKEQKHLKHFARLQLGLFLKGVGLSVEEALIWWRKMFNVGGKMSDDKFRKDYEYNIKHSYGLVGGKKNYPPKSCQTILTVNQPGAGDTHGCPFRHFSTDRLQSYLANTYHINGLDMQEVLAQVKSTHYHVACTRVFEITHSGPGGVKKGEGTGGGESVDHPNKWFDRSWELEKLAGGGEPSTNGNANGNGNGVKKEAKAEVIEDMSMDDDQPLP